MKFHWPQLGISRGAQCGQVFKNLVIKMQRPATVELDANDLEILTRMPEESRRMYLNQLRGVLHNGR